MPHNFSRLLFLLPLCILNAQATAQTHYPYSPPSWDEPQEGAQYYNGDADSRSRNRIYGAINPTAAGAEQDRYGRGPNAGPQGQHAPSRQAPVMDNRGVLYGGYPAPVIMEKKRSALEAMYAERIVDDIEQFGYDLFGIPRPETRSTLSGVAEKSFSMPSGSVQDDFTLNIGDQLEIVFTGQRHDRDIYNVNSQGLLLIRDFPPIPAAGRNMGQVRISIEAAARTLHNTEAHISLASVRQIGVLVVGHVKRPGRQSMTVFHTILDALMESGGVEKTGSLRQIKLIRDGRTVLIDIYSLLLYGATNADLQLRDGDRIVVPSIGPTIAISGEVKRPGIYEIMPRMAGMAHTQKAESEKLSLNEVLELAGGVLVSGQNRFLELGIGSDGQEHITEITDEFAKHFRDGSILVVSKGKEKRAGMVELSGHTRKPGIHALNEVPMLSDLLPNGTVLGEDIYPLLGVIERWDNEELAHAYLDFPLRLVISGDFDMPLKEDDVIHLFSKTQIAALQSGKDDRASRHASSKGAAKKSAWDREGSAQNEIMNASYEYEEGSRPDTYQNGYNDHHNAGSKPNDKDAPIESHVLASFLSERAVFVRGAVRNPGYYPVAQGITLENLLTVAGGLALEANTSNIEVTSTLKDKEGLKVNDQRQPMTRRVSVNLRETNPKDVTIGPGDSIRVNQKFDKIHDRSVLIMGEVLNPGRYDLIPGDKVSDLIKRAGGMNNQAYPQGSIFSRDSERRAEESRYRAAARDLERALAVALEKEDGKAPNVQQIAMARELASELREVEAVGRITVETDPGILSAHPEVDMLLESGDRIFIPKRPMSVRVSGEILSPASLQFRERKKPLDYIHESGGFTYHADKDRTFVLYPDGSAQPLQVSSWNHKPVFVPPGSTIVVPRDPKPFDFIQSAKDISQIMSNLAITAIFLDDVRDN